MMRDEQPAEQRGDAADLRDIANAIDGPDAAVLRDIAAGIEYHAELMHRRAAAELEAVVDKERAIYWLLRSRKWDGRGEAAIGADRCLRDLGYVWGSERALRMLALGEPGRNESPEAA